MEKAGLIGQLHNPTSGISGLAKVDISARFLKFDSNIIHHAERYLMFALKEMPI